MLVRAPRLKTVASQSSFLSKLAEPAQAAVACCLTISSQVSLSEGVFLAQSAKESPLVWVMVGLSTPAVVDRGVLTVGPDAPLAHNLKLGFLKSYVSQTSPAVHCFVLEQVFPGPKIPAAADETEAPVLTTGRTSHLTPSTLHLVHGLVM